MGRAMAVAARWGAAVALVGAAFSWLVRDDLRRHGFHVQAEAEAHAPQAVMGRYAPVATYDPADRRLVVTDALPRDAFVCIRGECRLAEAWLDLLRAGGQ